MPTLYKTKQLHTCQNKVCFPKVAQAKEISETPRVNMAIEMLHSLSSIIMFIDIRRMYH